jgi:hypothetical protein
MQISSSARCCAYLSDVQIHRLRALHVPIVIPSVLPPGYRLARFYTNDHHFENGVEVELEFVGPAGRRILIEESKDVAQGDAAPDYLTFSRHLSVKSKLLGRVVLTSGDGRKWSADDVPIRFPPRYMFLFLRGDARADLISIFASLRLLPRR